MKIARPAPPSIADYNKNMNSVDKFDQLMSSYNIDRRSKKWWHRIFFYFLDAAVLNAYISYKHFIDIELKNFKGKCAEGFVTETLLDKIPPSETTLRSIPIRIKNSKPTVSLEIRKTSSKHQPIRVHGTRRRCALCSTKKKSFAHRGDVLYVKSHCVRVKKIVLINIICRPMRHGGTVYVCPTH